MRLMLYLLVFKVFILVNWFMEVWSFGGFVFVKFNWICVGVDIEKFVIYLSFFFISFDCFFFGFVCVCECVKIDGE